MFMVDECHLLWGDIIGYVWGKTSERVSIPDPVEDIWLQAKRLIREFYFFCHSFSVVKALFELSVSCQIFDFPKLHEYGVF